MYPRLFIRLLKRKRGWRKSFTISLVYSHPRRNGKLICHIGYFNPNVNGRELVINTEAMAY